MKQFTEDFRTKLYDTVNDIENNSQIEIVVLIKSQSGSYKHIPLWTGIIFSFILFTFFMFSPFSFDVFLIYVFTILSFFAVYTLLTAMPAIGRKLIKEKHMQKNVEICARALFQKGGLRFTSSRIGTLIYFSIFEKKAFIVPDRGAETAIPAQEWDIINKRFQDVFSAPDVPSAILKSLADCKAVFPKYIPSVENDINELPDNLEIEL